MTAVVALLAVVTIAAASLGLAYAGRAAAQTAADASALAAAVATYPGTGRPSPVSEARRVAWLNHAILGICRCPVDRSLSARVVEVVAIVLVDVPIFGPLRVTAASRAEFDPGLWLGR